MMLISSFRLGCLCLIVAGVFLVSGCGPQEPPTGTAKIRLTLNDEPLSGFRATLICKRTRDSFIAPVDANGSISIDAPMPVETYTIYLLPEGDAPLGKTMPEKYRREETSDLTVDLKEGPNEFDLKLKP